jgi:Lipase (class 3)
MRGSPPEPARRASSGQPVKTATWTLLLTHLLVGGLTSAGCVSSPDELQPETSEIPSAVESNEFDLPAQSEIYYMVMASAAASAYPARFDGTTMEIPDDQGFTDRVLRADRNLRLISSATDETMFTTYSDNSSPNVLRVIIAFRGTVKPRITAPLSDLSAWKDLHSDIISQFHTINHQNALLDTDAVGTVGFGWQLRWYAALNTKNKALRDLITKDTLTYTRVKHVEVNIVGHSLGGVVAELAGFDIEAYLNHNTTNYAVNVIAFNPPRIGNQKFVDEYRRRLKARPDRFKISVFTREGDIVDDLPINFPLGIIGGSYRQAINNVAHDNLTPICSRYMFGGTDDPNEAGPDGEARRLPYAPRFHATKPFAYGSHSIDDWVGDPRGNIEHRQVLDRINPTGFRCMFAPRVNGGTVSQRTSPPYEPLLNCTEYSKSLYAGECNPSPPRGDGPRDEL